MEEKSIFVLILRGKKVLSGGYIYSLASA